MRAVLRGTVRALLQHTRPGEAGATRSQRHQRSRSSAARGSPAWQLPLLTPVNAGHGQAGQRSGRSDPALSHGTAAGEGGQRLPGTLHGANPPAQEVPRGLDPQMGNATCCQGPQGDTELGSTAWQGQQQSLTGADPRGGKRTVRHITLRLGV